MIRISIYDEIIFYDDYKDEYKDVRAKVFQFLQPVNLDKSTNALAEKRATDIWNQIPLKIQNGRIKNETINEYLKLILLNLSFTWDMSSSLYYLTVKTLGDVNNVQLIDKNSALFAMIKTALTEKSRIQPDNFNEEIQILNSKGQPIHKGDTINGSSKITNGLDPSTKRFFSSLSWLSYRTAKYTYLAEYYMADLVLHPIRNGFLVNILPCVFNIEPAKYKPIIEAITHDAEKTLIDINGNSVNSYKLPLPFFSAWMINQGCKPHQLIDKAYELKEDKLFQQARQQFTDIDVKLMIHKNKKFNTEKENLINELKKTLEQVKSKYSVSTRQGIPLNSIIMVYNLYASVNQLPQIPVISDLKVPMPDFVNSAIVDHKPRKGFAALLKSVVDDLAQVEKFGSILDDLKEDIDFDEKANKGTVKTIEPSYLGKSTHWSSPME